MKRYIIAALLLCWISGFGQNNPIFGGGHGDGWANAGYQQPENNIYAGGHGDGWAVGSYAQESNNIYKGGIGDGWANGTSPLTVLAVVENDFASGFVAYPNPTSGGLDIALGQLYATVEVQVSNVLGQTVSRQRYRSVDKVALQIDGQRGTYFVRLTADNKNATIKVLKQ